MLEPIKYNVDNLTSNYKSNNLSSSCDTKRLECRDDLLSNSMIAKTVSMQIAVAKSKNKIVLNDNQMKLLAELEKKGKIDWEHIELFRRIYDRNGNYEPQKAYNEIAEFLNIKNLAPEVNISNQKYEFCSYNPITAVIKLSQQANAGGLLSTIRHELEHFKQMRIVYSCLGENAMLDAFVEDDLFQFKNNPKACEQLFGKAFSLLTDKELSDFKEKQKENIKKIFNSAFYEKIKKTTTTDEERQKANLYLKNMQRYDGINGIMEDEAYKVQVKFKLMEQEFLNILKNP